MRISKSEQQRIIRDALIARAVRRAGALLVTDNVSDFKMIRSFAL